MAMNVSFLKGLYSKYASLATKDPNTFYLTYESGSDNAMGGTIRLFLGAEELTNKVNIAALVERIEVLEDWKDAFPEYVLQSDYSAHLQTQANVDKKQTEDIAQLRSDLDEITDIGGEPNKVDDVQINGTSIVANKIANFTADGTYNASTNKIATVSTVNNKADAIMGAATNGPNDLTIYGTRAYADAQAGAAKFQIEGSANDTKDSKTIAGAKKYADDVLEQAKDYTDEEITGLEFALSTDGKTLELKNKAGNAVAELDTTKFVKDGMISSVAISEDGANLVITWNTDAGISATNIPLTELVDVMTGVAGTTITVNVSADDKISAEVNTGSLKDGHIASDAAIAKSKLAQNVQDSLDLADSAIQEADLGDLAFKNEADLKLGDYAKTADLGTAAAKNVEFFATKAQGDLADSALQEVTIAGTKLTKTSNTISKETISAALNLTGGADSFDGRLTTAQTTANEAKQGVADINTDLSTNYKTWTATQTAIQGATTNTVKDCVDAINALNAGSAQANKDISAISTSVNDVVTQLTWGSF